MELKYLFLNAVVLTLCLFGNFSNGQLSLQTDQKQGFLSKPFENKNPKGPLKPLKNLGNVTIQNDQSLKWRLPTDVVPLNYKLTITPILEAGHEAIGEQWTVPGEVIIEVEAKVDTNLITLHAKYLEIKTVQVFHGSTNIPVIYTSFHNEHSFVSFLLSNDNQLRAGEKYTLQIVYTAPIQEELHGLYRSSYLDPTTNTTKTIAVSQMEALNARELFPCFDEPSFKAIFDVTVGRRENHVALANGQSVGNVSMGEGKEGWVWEKFEPTVPMSTYLFALVVSEFKFAEAPGTVLPDVTVRTYAPEHYISRKGGEYASEKSELILAHYGEYFGHDYPLQKMDMVASPSFYFGAMENFGLNIYREELLLFFPDETTEAERFRLTNVISHELAHQWFGNLVSPAWWTHIWLNEGMSTYVEFNGMEKVIPEFEPWKFFVTDSLQYALYYDGIKEFSHPLKIIEEQWIERDPMDWFDQLTYQKGGSLAKMIEGFLTEDVMKQGLNQYQTVMKYSAAVQDNLFDELNKVATAANKLPAGTTINEIMSSWTLQAGFPLVRVFINGEGKIELTQEKFGDSSSTDLWTIPLSIATMDNLNFDPAPEVWLTESNLVLNDEFSTWLIVNAGASGYYRVLYDSNIRPLIVEKLQADHTKINHLSRSQLLDDYFNLAANGYTTITDALSFIKYLRSGSEPEVEIIVWTPVFTNLETALNLFGSGGMLEDLRAFLLPAINRAIAATGGIDAINTDSKGVEVLRHTQFLDWACALSDEACHEYAVKLVNEWRADPANNPIQRDLKPIIYCAAVSSGGKDISDFIHENYRNEEITTKQRDLLLNALGCVGEPQLIEDMLKATVQDGYFLEKSHGIVVLQKLASNLKARSALLAFLSSNTNEIINYFGNVNPIVQTVSALSRFISTRKELAEIEALAANLNIGTNLQSSLNAIKQNIEWVQTFGVITQNFFKEELKEPVTTTTTAPTTTTYTGTPPTGTTPTGTPPTGETETPPPESTPSSGFTARTGWKLIPALQTLLAALFLSRA